ncbi:MAG: thiamine-phosphate kinase [Sphingobium sp.]
MNESEFIARLRGLATHPAARGLMDDAAVLDLGGQGLVLTHDMLVEGVHYLPDDPPHSVAWKLIAVNMSDLAAKGAKPLGVMLGFSLTGGDDWDEAFVQGLDEALTYFNVPLLGGDTVSMPAGAPRALGLTAIGAASIREVPSRTGAKPGDLLFVSGALGSSGAGLAILRDNPTPEVPEAAALIDAYRRPMPDMALGQVLAPFVTAMADISDGLLIDARRIAEASCCAASIDIAMVPLSPDFVALRGNSTQDRLFAATAGDDYRLLFAVDPSRRAEIEVVANSQRAQLTKVGRFAEGAGLSIHEGEHALPLPSRLGYLHG